MYYTYILRSIKQPGAIYIGYTKDLRLRLHFHNNPARKDSTKRYCPWVIESYFAFTAEQNAKDFERYLKSNSGKAFMRKRLISGEFKEALKKFNNGRLK
jgi:predicted GIY-YIG superfamily endonuclease